MCYGKHSLCKEKMKRIIFTLQSGSHTGYGVIVQCWAKVLKAHFLGIWGTVTGWNQTVIVIGEGKQASI